MMSKLRGNDPCRGRHVPTVLLVIACVLGLACSGGGSSGPEQGSPEWYWAAALGNHAAADYDKTEEHLAAIMKTENDFSAKAALWRAALLAGLARGYDDLAGAYQQGREENESQFAEAGNMIADYRRQTRKNAIAFSEGTGALKKLIGSQESVSLDFPLPEGSGNESPILGTVKGGGNPGTQAAAVEDQTLTRGILLAAATLSGAGDDIAKAKSQFGAGAVSVPRGDFEFAVAGVLLDASIMFDRKGINEPKVREVIFGMAEKWAEPYLEDEAYKERAEDFNFDVANERRDMEGKRRIKKED